MTKKKNVSNAQEKNIILDQNSSFAVKEAYKTLRTNISFSLPGSGCKCIGITSAERGDGKSTIATNLAISFAQINKKVLVVDCDMRLPTIAKKLGINSTPGLSNYLVSKEQEEGKLVHRVSEMGIDVIPAGNIPPDPTKLLESPQMEEVIEDLKSYYDYIIFDFPPIALVADAAILSKSIDGYLLIVKHAHSEHAKLTETLRQMEFSEAKIIGFVYNGKSEHSYRYKLGNKRYSRSNYYYYYYK